MSWVSTRTKPPPAGLTLFVRSGSVIFFAAYSKWQEKWFHLHNGTETECEPPEFYWAVDGTNDEIPVPKTAADVQKQLSLGF